MMTISMARVLISDAGSSMEFEWNTREDAYTLESENPLPDPDTDVRTQDVAKEAVCYREDKKISEEDVCCTDIRSVNQRDVDVRCANNVSDWSLKHSLTVAWCVNAEDSSYIAVCYDCLWLIDHSRTLMFWFYEWIR